MSKERARRRAERETVAAEERRRRAARRHRAEARAHVVGSVTAPVAKAQNRVARWWRRTYPPQDPFARRRRRQAFVLLGLFAVVQVLVWWLLPSWPVRLAVLLLSLFLLPVARVVLFDRR